MLVRLPALRVSAAVDTLAGNIGALTGAQFNVSLAQLIAMAGDSHTHLYLKFGDPIPEPKGRRLSLA